MQELYEHPLEPMACLVDGLLAPGLYILGGSPKVGKSWMALQLCLAVCGGKAFLGRATRKSEVLYLAPVSYTHLEGHGRGDYCERTKDRRR